MTLPSIPDPAVLAAFINTVAIGWLLVVTVLAAILAVVLVGIWATARDTRPAPKHKRGIGRTLFQIPPTAQPRPAQHSGHTAAADTALLPAIAPVYLGPPTDTLHAGARELATRGAR